MLSDLKGFKEKWSGIGEQYIFEFDNGYGASVIAGVGAYGDKQHPYELAVLKDGELCYETEITDDVVGFLDKNLVEQFLKEIVKLDKDGRVRGKIMKTETIKSNSHTFKRCGYCGKELKVGDRIVVIRSGAGMKVYCEICGSRIDDENEQNKIHKCE